MIERAAILAAGSDYAEVIAWITAHAGEPETTPAASPQGLHGRPPRRGAAEGGTPSRFILPADALAAQL